MNEYIKFDNAIKPDFYNKFYEYWKDKIDNEEIFVKKKLKTNHLNNIKKIKINEHMLVDFLFHNKILLINALLENMAQCLMKDELFNKFEYVSKLLDITYIIYFKTYRNVCDKLKKNIGLDSSKFLFYTKTRYQFVKHLIEKGVIVKKN